MSDKIFLTYKKFLHFCPNENFCQFSKFEISSKLKKYSISQFHFLEIHPFFTIRITKKNKNNNNNYAQFDLTVLSLLSFHFRPDHSTKVSLDIIIIRLVKLRKLDLESILKQFLLVSLSVVTFSPAFKFSQLTFL